MLGVVEGHARADDIQHRGAAVRKRRLEQFLDLLWIAGKGARHERAVRGQGFQANVHGHVGIGALVLERQADLGRGGELPFGQAVDAVVLDDVQHVDVAADDVLELPHADAGRVAVTGEADALQPVVAEQRAGGDRGHAPMQAVETERAVQEVGRRLARAADAAELDDILRHDVHLVQGADDLVGDRVVAAALAQRGG